jgi:UPF0755 protein
MSSRSFIRTIIYIVVVVFILAGIQTARVYKKAFGPNIQTPDKNDFYLFIPTGTDYNGVLEIIKSNHLAKNEKTLVWVAEKKNYAAHVHPGRYRIKHGMSYNEFINLLRSGLQEPVNVVITGARTMKDLAERLAVQIEPDSETLLRMFTSEDFIEGYGFNKQTVLGMFLPNTYEVWWNTSAEDFFKRMYREYEKFWNRQRTGKAEEIGLSANEVITLASIIVQETNKEDEYRRMAGVYINRLNQGIKLQADPTVKYALGDYERKRVLKKDTYVDSPYNTYLYYGLPPGPIALPSIRCIDAVLNYEKHDYLYFCAREDFSGYHNFARTLDQHNKNARLYQKALNRRNILK